MNVIAGLDIGGAHLKMATVDNQGQVQQVHQWKTPLWQGLESLQIALGDIQSWIPLNSLDAVAVTMTGELVDGFQTRHEGVTAISDCVESCFQSVPVFYYGGKSGFLNYSDCQCSSADIASANWYGTAQYCANALERGILLDLGSTTADLVPFANQRVLANGLTDHDRLRHHELCYTGVVRTPVMAVVNEIDWHGEPCPVMNEYFANMADVYRITGDLPDDADLYPACDGQTKNRTGSLRRLARMLGLDYDNESQHENEWHRVAEFISQRQQQLLLHSTQSVLEQCSEFDRQKQAIKIVGAGCGRFLVRKVANELQLPYVDITSVIHSHDDQKESAADCAAAVAIANLLRQIV